MLIAKRAQLKKKNVRVNINEYWGIDRHHWRGGGALDGNRRVGEPPIRRGLYPLCVLSVSESERGGENG